MTSPPPYPRTPYLKDDPDPFLGVPLRVEEKLDGSNVAVWIENGSIKVMSRGGVTAMDRGRQLGRLRAWASERHEAIQDLAMSSGIIYGEWLWLRHGVTYDRLPDWLVVLDLWTAEGGFLHFWERDSRVEAVGMVMPPIIRTNFTLSTIEEVTDLIVASRWGSGRAEGVVLRRADGRRCKVVRADYAQRTDSEWAGAAVLNHLA